MQFFSKAFYRILLLGLLLLTGCMPFPEGKDANSSSGSPTVTFDASNLPDVRTAAHEYLDAWSKEDYPTMYALLTSISRDAMSEQEFTEHYQGIASEVALTGVDTKILSSLTNPDTAQVGYRVILHSILVGDIERSTVMNLRLEEGEWKVQWDDTLVLPELKGGNYLWMEREGYTPSRANIYDRAGRALVAQADVVAIGLYPDKIDPEREDELLVMLSDLTGQQPKAIKAQYADFPKGAGWYLPLGEVPVDLIEGIADKLRLYDGFVMKQYQSRFYFENGIAPHVVGYVSAIQPEEVDEYRRKGYQKDERVGRSGLEQWGEQYLSGKRGGALYVLDMTGKPVTRLAESEAEPSQAIYTTLDRDFQLAVQRSIEPFRGAVVVLERDTGKVLAMVSSPGFDPNAFEPRNFNSATQLSTILGNPDQPLLNRATLGQYPPGSIFKVITMAAGLESGLYPPETEYQCGYFFEELPGVQLHDWTYEYFLQNHHTIPSGLLTLPQGLMRSCNPFFWHIGLGLYNHDMTTAVSDMARGFGLGSPTGIIGLEELPGQVPDPQTAIDAVNMAIGQGDLLVTPLQMANFIAAIGNGGTLYKPQVIEKITAPGSTPVMSFKPESIRKLSVTSENLKVIQDAMVGVIRNEKPRGTAWHVFTGLDISVAGKTGTAQSGSDKPHAWFAGYTFENRQDKPDIAVVVLVENIGEGSMYAAPIFRRIVEIYFSGKPLKLYPWESSLNMPVTRNPDELITPYPVTPLPEGQETPAP